MNDLSKLFLLDPNITYLNHGSFGAVPVPVFQKYQMWQKDLEFHPVEFLSRRAPELLYQSRLQLANYLHTKPENLVYVTNTTEGINIIARSLSLSTGDEVLMSDHEYGALERTWKFVSQKRGFSIKKAIITLPYSEETFIQDIWKNVNKSTRVIFLSHITSPTACIFPVKGICQRAKDENILTVIDGAHVPGQLNLDLTNLDADFYVGNLHKWLCSPKGSAFLYASKQVQDLIEPLIVSWGWESDHPGPSRFNDYLEWTGTRDISSFLSVPAAIQFQHEHDWHFQRQRCHDLAVRCLGRINELTGMGAIYAHHNQFAQMVSIRLPNNQLDETKIALYDRFHIEVPLIDWNSNQFIRVSFQGYNDDKDISILVDALTQLLPIQGVK